MGFVSSVGSVMIAAVIVGAICAAFTVAVNADVVVLARMRDPTLREPMAEPTPLPDTLPFG